MTTTYYTREHEYLQLDGDVGAVGITDFAQGQLGDVVFVELPEVGAQTKQGDQAAVVESVKAASEVYAPVAGSVTAGNTALADDPSIVNSDPEGEGWFFKLKVSNAAEFAGLMTSEQYLEFAKGH